MESTNKKLFRRSCSSAGAIKRRGNSVTFDDRSQRGTGGERNRPSKRKKKKSLNRSDFAR